MKDTYIDDKIEFYVENPYEGMKKDYPTVCNMDLIYGTSISNLCEELNSSISLILCGERKIKTNFSSFIQKSVFEIPANYGLTVEEATENYILKNFSKFDEVQKIHALSFLQKYCMDYKEVKKKFGRYLRKGN